MRSRAATVVARPPNGRPSVRNLRLRDELPPDDDVVVIRGGVLEERTDEQLRTRARRSEATIGLLAQSVLLAEREDVPRVCRDDARISRYKQVSLSTVARIGQAGFPLEPTLDAPHYSVVLPDLSVETIDRFRRCFDAAQPSPPSTLPR